MLCIDSSAIIEVLLNSKTGLDIVNFLEGREYYISSIIWHEVFVGLNKNEEMKAYFFLDGVEIFGFGAYSSFASVQIEKILRINGQLINRMDILIAGQCQSNNFELVTCDKGFLKIPSLAVHMF